MRQRFYGENELVERYQRQSSKFKKALAVELIHSKSFKDVAARFNTSPTKVMRRFDEVGAKYLTETQKLPAVIAIDEYRGDVHQAIISDPVNRRPLKILSDLKKKQGKNI